MPDEKETQAKAQALQHPIWLPDSFKSYLADFALRTATDFYAKQTEGFRATRFVSATPAPDPTTVEADGSPTDGQGPTLTGLANGTYLFVVGYTRKSGDISSHRVRLRVNGLFPDFAPALGTGNDRQDIDDAINAFGFIVVDIKPNALVSWTNSPSQIGPTANDNNTVTMWYACSAGEGFERRFLHAIKIERLVNLQT